MADIIIKPMHSPDKVEAALDLMMRRARGDLSGWRARLARGEKVELNDLPPGIVRALAFTENELDTDG